jgi:hypothetical protein
LSNQNTKNPEFHLDFETGLTWAYAGRSKSKTLIRLAFHFFSAAGRTFQLSWLLVR